MGIVNSTDFKSYGKPLEEELEGGWETPLPEKKDEVEPEKKEE